MPFVSDLLNVLRSRFSSVSPVSFGSTTADCIARNFTVFSRWGIGLSLLFSGLSTAVAQQIDASLPNGSAIQGSTPALESLWISELSKIENLVQANVLQAGDRQYDTLPDFYWGANPDLRKHLDSIVDAYHHERHGEYRGMTIIAGTAGVGKTFIKSGLLGQGSSSIAVEKFDIRDWFTDFKERGLADFQADLTHGDHAMCQLLRLTEAGRTAFAERVAGIDKAFFVMDSLDEVHPDDYLFLLETIQDFVSNQRGSIQHAFVFGRPLVFREYWHQCCNDLNVQGLSCFVLNPPAFRTVGDLEVSSWNYHCWKHKLRSLDDAGNSIEMPLETYIHWRGNGFQLPAESFPLVIEANQTLVPAVQDTVEGWASKYPCVASVLGNLAGNSMVREIVESSIAEGYEYSEHQFKEEFFAKWLERDTLSGDRPSRLKPRDLDVYVKLLEAVAVRYADKAVASGNGFFEVQGDDEVVVTHDGASVSVFVEQLLNRSGLVNLDAQRPGDAMYRFEPLWFHRWLIEKHQERSETETGREGLVTVREID